MLTHSGPENSLANCWHWSVLFVEEEWMWVHSPNLPKLHVCRAHYPSPPFPYPSLFPSSLRVQFIVVGHHRLPQSMWLCNITVRKMLIKLDHFVIMKLLFYQSKWQIFKHGWCMMCHLHGCEISMLIGCLGHQIWMVDWVQAISTHRH